MAYDLLTLFDKFDKVLPISECTNVANQFANYNGTPNGKHSLMERCPLKYTCCDRSSKNEVIHSRAAPQIKLVA